MVSLSRNNGNLSKVHDEISIAPSTNNDAKVLEYNLIPTRKIVSYLDLNIKKEKLNRRTVTGLGLINRINKALKYNSNIPPDIEKGKEILENVIETYRNIPQNLKEKDLVLSMARYHLGSMQITYGEAENDINMGLENIKEAAKINDFKGIPNYTLAKTYFNSWIQKGKPEGESLEIVQKLIKDSLISDSNNAGSLILQYYIENKNCPENVKCKKIKSFIRNHPAKKRDNLKYYFAKLGKEGLFGKAFKKKAITILESLSKNLNDRNYKKAKSNIYLGKFYFKEENFRKAKEYFLAAIENVAGRTKETYTKLFHIHVKATDSKHPHYDKSLNIEHKLGIKGKKTEEVEDFFRKWKVPVNTVYKKEDEVKMRNNAKAGSPSLQSSHYEGEESKMPSGNVFLSGSNLTPLQVISIAKGRVRIEIPFDAMERVNNSHTLLRAATDRHSSRVYGMTVGVGGNKDVTVSVGKEKNEVEASRKKFNDNLVYATSAAVGPPIDEGVVKAMMTIRLNTILYGTTGVRVEVAEILCNMLNNDIIPVIPKKGSIGEGDITIHTHMALAMIGEGEVYYKGKKTNAGKALRDANIQLLEPTDKDILSIMSHNAYTDALAVFALDDLTHVLEIGKKTFSLSLEAYNGNITPFLSDTNDIKRIKEVNEMSEEIKKTLKGSYLFNFEANRPLQDPLSFRTAAYTLSAMAETQKELARILYTQLNSSSDNPVVILNAVPQESAGIDEDFYKQFYVDDTEESGLKGAVIPTANFCQLPIAIALEKATISIAENSVASSTRISRISDLQFEEGGPRFLGTSETSHAFGAVQKVYAGLTNLNIASSNPTSFNGIPLAGNVEDTATHSPTAAYKLIDSIDNLYNIFALEAMHAAQAMELRNKVGVDKEMSPVTKKFFDCFREEVAFRERDDRTFSEDIQKSYIFLKKYEKKKAENRLNSIISEMDITEKSEDSSQEFFRSFKPEDFFSSVGNGVVLGGENLDIGKIMSIAKEGTKIEISSDAMKRVDNSHTFLRAATDRHGAKVYGITVGVGGNKDVNVSDQDKIKFNKGLIYSTSAGMGSPIDKGVVKAMMTIRLNTILYGTTGARVEVARILCDMLNNDIIPVIPKKGSIGEGDITIHTHMALAMIGEGEVYYKGEKRNAKEALKDADIQLLEPTDKDVLSIMSHNAYSNALSIFALYELNQVISMAELVFCLSLEAYNGNITPFLSDTNKCKKNKGVNATSIEILNILQGSYLLKTSSERALQDPLSFRVSAYVIGALKDSKEEIVKLLETQINSSEDNPVVRLDITPKKSEGLDEHLCKQFYVDDTQESGFKGAIIPTANFCQLPLSNSLQKLTIALAHASVASSTRTIRLGDLKVGKEAIHFLGTPKTFHAFGAVPNVSVSLVVENYSNATPLSFHGIPIEGNVEDMATNAPIIARKARKARKSINNLFFLLSLELLHAAQAIDLRKQKNSFEISPITGKLLEKFRGKVDFRDEDNKDFTRDIKESYNFLKAYSIEN